MIGSGVGCGERLAGESRPIAGGAQLNGASQGSDTSPAGMVSSQRASSGFATFSRSRGRRTGEKEQVTRCRIVRMRVLLLQSDHIRERE